MHLTFLGTGGGAPSLQRNVTSIAFTRALSGETWLFDCGKAHNYSLCAPASNRASWIRFLSPICMAIIFSGCRDYSPAGQWPG